MTVRPSTENVTPSWLELVWMEAQDEIDYERAHPQEPFCTCDPQPSHCLKHGDGK